ncbi:PREDICTED: myb/SANT-like DNA-binding domain-containing protein 4 [Rhagoletis zephyria]|uniref:myb/SANT-like DNA-binding domain-containing protein 4 n=1 Tax=Rhagoletis zephyria TaxID=28612 RepID=UPI00081186A2|nr:PREDICTED: myb/SANT-like DNA-binding domain-containing protein 4 [Rhagoletis zephyria]XP_017474667.1 PREDICTED: myb/SANT-like DNA-binding domain-containing protein 4 [Rhagoletis zephyria]XP_017474668.1 PREDICTED: myb/SANT-like DNA-binding domain-containing protein 4 [Rhagoletis zephyria]XP_017474669.1 PREDICTED: myb/SANT-like DNA-binding domain-containing protein 4 [Rhagoletis zephyria]XP_017474671.1 PREDICTED: myb/SANT-like DNA-binding domain-containing protein 4 [Rhagoletis zephyria]XP_03
MESQTRQRLRAPNFTKCENLLLRDCIQKRKNVIENKKTDRNSLQQKQEAWMEVAKEFNEANTGIQRTVESLQQNYKNLKKKLRKRKLLSSRQETVAETFNTLTSEKKELVSAKSELLQIQLIDEQERLEHNRLLRKMEFEDAQKRYEHNETIRMLQLEEYS